MKFDSGSHLGHFIGYRGAGVRRGEEMVHMDDANEGQKDKASNGNGKSPGGGGARLSWDEMRGVPSAGERDEASKTIENAKAFLNRWRDEDKVPLLVSGKHRTMVHTYHLAMETATPEGITPPSAKEATEALIEIGWVCMHLSVERRREIVEEAEYAAKQRCSRP